MKRDAQWVAQATGGVVHGQAQTTFVTTVTDSREAIDGALYVARRGENSDGHDYVGSALAQGASMILCERVIEDCPVTQVIVEDSTLALGAMAREHVADLRSSGSLQVVAVTGSAGKTTTKDLLAQVLGSFAPTVAPKLSFNNEVGLPLTCLKADQDTRYLVLEMGASGPGHLRYLTDIVAPDIAVELMVGHAHLGGFGSVEGVARAKQELVEGLVKGGVSILNADDPHVRAMSAAAPGPVRFFSVNEASDATYCATDVHVDEDERVSFTLLRRDLEASDLSVESARVNVQLVGSHHVSNALAAASVCCELGLPVDQVAHALSEATAQSPHRMAVHHITVHGHPVTLIDDSYNANSDSMHAALRAACALAREDNLIAVLGEMLELGESSQATHEEVGRLAKEYGVQALVTLGDEAVHYCTPLREDITTVHERQWREAYEATLKLISAPSVVLVKGSNGSGAWCVADALIEREDVQ